MTAKGWAKEHWRELALPGALLLVALVCLRRSEPWNWLGYGALLASLGPLMALARGATWPAGWVSWCETHRGRLVEVGTLLLLVVFFDWWIGDATLGSRPINHDHPVHYFKAWETNQMLMEGKLRGWSDAWTIGYPANYLYPHGPSLFVVGVYWACLGTVSFSSAYGLALFLMSVGTGHAIFRMGKKFVGPWTGLIAAILFALDIGSFRYGGWANVLNWGVWPQQLGIMFAAYGLAELPAILQSDSKAPMGRFAFGVGFSIVGHPASILMLGMCVPPMLIGVLALDKPKRVRALTRLAIAGGLGILIAGLYLFPFLDTKEFAQNRGKHWRDATEMGKAAWDGVILKGTGWFVHALAAIGALRLMRGRDWRHWYIVICGVALIALGTSTFLLEMGSLGERVDENVNQQRISGLLKPFFFIAAGYAAVAVWRVTRDRTPPSPEEASKPRPVLRALAILVATVLVAPWALAWLSSTHDYYEKKTLTPVEKRPWIKQRQKFLEFARTLPHDGVTRWANLFHKKPKPLAFTDMGTELGAPIYKNKATPCAIYKYRTGSLSTGAFKAANIRYAFGPKKHKGPKNLKLIKTFGKIHVYEFPGWEPEPFKVLAAKGKGKGKGKNKSTGEVELVSYAPEEIVIRAGEGASGKLRLNVSHFPRWHATRDGEELEIEAKPVRGASLTGLMTVDLEPGEYRFSFERAPVDYWSSALGIAGMLSSFGLMLWPIVPWVRRRRRDAGPAEPSQVGEDPEQRDADHGEQALTDGERGGDGGGDAAEDEDADPSRLEDA